jgi:hypothetical protein
MELIKPLKSFIVTFEILLLALTENIRLGLTELAVTNAPAYYGREYLRLLKVFKYIPLIDLCCQTLYGRNLQMLVIDESVCSCLAFQA